MIEVVQEGMMWTAYDDNYNLIKTSDRKQKVITAAKNAAEPNEKVQIQDSSVDDTFVFDPDTEGII